MRLHFLRVSFLFAFFAVLLGAFAAHLLKEMLEVHRLAIFETGVRYQFYHALALGLTGLLPVSFPEKWIKWAGRSFILGVFCFSGSLYLLALRDVLGIAHWYWLGPLTPIGGLLFLLGWLLLFISGFSQKS